MPLNATQVSYASAAMLQAGAWSDIDHPVNGIRSAIRPIDHGGHDDAIWLEGGIHTEVGGGFHGIQSPLGILLFGAIEIADRVDQMLLLGVDGGQGHIGHHHTALDDQMAPAAADIINSFG